LWKRHVTGVDFETCEVDLANKSEEFLAASPTGKVPVIVVDGDSLYESNVVNQYLDEVTDKPKLMPEDPRRRAHARIWMAFADTDFFPAVFVTSVGREGLLRGADLRGVREVEDGAGETGRAAERSRLPRR